MRNVTVAVQVVAVVAVFTVSAVGQQVLVYPKTNVDLPIEPLRLQIDTTLADAARRNDFPRFEALYNESHDSAYTEFRDFWKWSLTDPIGAFYGSDIHGRLSARYPDYAAFIDDYRIVDSRGNVFYPSAETRQFLLRHIGARKPLPLVATARPRVQEKPLVVVHKPAAKPAAKPAPVRIAVAKPKVVVVKPAVEHVPVVVAEPLVAKPVVKPLPKPVVVPVAPARVTVAHEVDEGRAARAIALIIAGLIGLVVLTTMLRPPRET